MWWQGYSRSKRGRLDRCAGDNIRTLEQMFDLLVFQVRETAREDVECDLHFTGFVIISCPLKADSKAVIREIQHASHHVSLTQNFPSQ